MVLFVLNVFSSFAAVDAVGLSGTIPGNATLVSRLRDLAGGVGKGLVDDNAGEGDFCPIGP